MCSWLRIRGCISSFALSLCYSGIQLDNPTLCKAPLNSVSLRCGLAQRSSFCKVTHLAAHIPSTSAPTCSHSAYKKKQSLERAVCFSQKESLLMHVTENKCPLFPIIITLQNPAEAVTLSRRVQHPRTGVGGVLAVVQGLRTHITRTTQSCK